MTSQRSTQRFKARWFRSCPWPFALSGRSRPTTFEPKACRSFPGRCRHLSGPSRVLTLTAFSDRHRPFRHNSSNGIEWTRDPHSGPDDEQRPRPLTRGRARRPPSPVRRPATAAPIVSRKARSGWVHSNEPQGGPAAVAIVHRCFHWTDPARWRYNRGTVTRRLSITLAGTYCVPTLDKLLRQLRPIHVLDAPAIVHLNLRELESITAAPLALTVAALGAIAANDLVLGGARTSRRSTDRLKSSWR